MELVKTASESRGENQSALENILNDKIIGNTKELLRIISGLSEKNSGGLIKILNYESLGWSNLDFQDILGIISAYDAYDGNSSLVSKELSHSSITIRKYWRLAGFKIHGRGRKMNSFDSEKYNNDEIKELIKENFSRNKIAKKIGVSYDEFIEYLRHHPELPALVDERKGIRHTIYNDYKSLIKEGLNQTEIAKRLKLTRQAVSYYLKRYPQLGEEYQEMRENKK